MTKRLIVWAVIALTVGTVSAQEPSDRNDNVVNRNDSVMKEITLGNIIVKGSPVVRKDDRLVARPQAEQIRTATDGMDLLRKMQLPRISINQMTGEVGITGGGNLRLCLNGVQVNSRELAAVRPEDIVRIEYHDSPGARYAGADAVIDYITRRHTTGGSLSGETMDALGSGKWASMDQLAAQYDCGRSSLMFTAGYMGQRRDNWVRDYDETWRYPDREVSRHETGRPVSIGIDMLQSHLSYSLAENDRWFFNARLSLDYNHVPAKEEGDRRTTLVTSETDRITDIYEHTHERSLAPSLDLYFQRSLGKGRQLFLDVVGTHIRTRSNRIYQETVYGGNLDNFSDINIAGTDAAGQPGATSTAISDICGRKSSLIAEAVFEQSCGNGRISAGLRHTQAYTINHYSGTSGATVAMRQAESSVFAEYGYHCGAWGATGGITATRIRYSQDNRRIERWAVKPSARLTFRPTRHFQLRYNADWDVKSPSLAFMGDAVQEVQSGMIRRGNPELKPFGVLSQNITAGYTARLVSIDLAAGYTHESNPVMETVIYEDGLFVRTYENQRSFRQLDASLTLTVRPWGDHLSLSVTPLVQRYFSRGNSYRYNHTISRLKVDTDFSYANWLLSYTTMMGPANTMYGEESLEERNMNIVLLGYRQPHWTIQAGVFNAFVNNYWMETRNVNALTPFTSRAHCNRNTYFTVKLSFNVSYGRQSQRRDKQINNEDRDAGIMKGTK